MADNKARAGRGMEELRAIVGPAPGPGHGECFIWQGESGVVAVDAGGAKSVGKHAGAHAPEILILSHDDSDHIRGAVALMDSAGSSLREMWVPAEWAILIRQIADSDPNLPLPEDDVNIDVRDIESDLANRLLAGTREGTEESSGPGQNRLEAAPLREVILAAERTLSEWNPSRSSADSGFALVERPGPVEQWYGAANLEEILRRVRYRAKALLGIFSAALAQNVTIRFFSIDLALSRRRPPWLTAGRPGFVTVANAMEAPHALAVRMPPGLPYTYTLSRITVQNRRALCTLLWKAPTTPRGGVLIWSDTDGNWMHHLTPSALTQLITTLSASSAPHHASGNTAHNKVWTELSRTSATMVMISAGGQKGQSYRPEYTALHVRRCCTWCRTGNTAYQEVVAVSGPAGSMQLLSSCLALH